MREAVLRIALIAFTLLSVAGFLILYVLPRDQFEDVINKLIILDCLCLVLIIVAIIFLV